MKKNLSIVVLALFAVLNVQAYKGELIYAKTVEGVEMLFTGINDEEVEVGGSVWGARREAVERGTTGVVTIPETVNGYRVTRICDKAFNYCALSGINIPNTVTRIGEEAFFVSSLTELIIPESVNYIGQKAFSWCRKLKNVVIHGKISTLEESTFEHCEELSSVELPEGLITIKQSAFNSCESLATTNLPESLECIEQFAFYDCYSLQGIVLPENLKSIGVYCFNNCLSITEISIPNGIETIPDGAFSGCTALSTALLHEGLCVIGADAFSLCSKLTMIDFPETLHLLGMHSFSDCTSLESIVIPKNVRVIEEGAFSFCPSLSSISVDEANPYFDSRNHCNAIVEKEGSRLISGCKNTVIPNDILIIGAECFNGCSDLHSIEIPECVLAIESVAFANTALVDVILPSQLETIGGYAFANCFNLSSVVMDNLVKSVGSGAFNGCTKLQSIELSQSLLEIHSYAFTGCTNLEDVISYAEKPCEIVEEVFYCYYPHDYIYDTATLHVPYGCADIYRATPAWSKFKNICEMEHIGIDLQTISEGSVVEEARYTVDGFKAGSHKRGLNIVVMSDGSRRKVMVK